MQSKNNLILRCAAFQGLVQWLLDQISRWKFWRQDDIPILASEVVSWVETWQKGMSINCLWYNWQNITCSTGMWHKDDWTDTVMRWDIPSHSSIITLFKQDSDVDVGLLVKCWYLTTRPHGCVPEDQHWHLHHHENLKSLWLLFTTLIQTVTDYANLQNEVYSKYWIPSEHLAMNKVTACFKTIHHQETIVSKSKFTNYVRVVVMITYDMYTWPQYHSNTGRDLTWIQNNEDQHIEWKCVQCSIWSMQK
jgi:hypothetical protein